MSTVVFGNRKHRKFFVHFPMPGPREAGASEPETLVAQSRRPAQGQSPVPSESRQPVERLFVPQCL